MSKEMHLPTNYFIAHEINQKFGTDNGVAIDIGAGDVSLAINIAKITHLKVYAMNISKKNCLTDKNMYNEKLEGRLISINGNPQEMPFDDEFADLIVSKSTLFSWKNMPETFKEINRVLKPGGTVYIGGCTSKNEMKTKNKTNKGKNKKDCVFGHCQKNCKVGLDTIENAVNQAEIKGYLLISDESGVWLSFEKNLIKRYGLPTSN
jgi:ubiquinone/menaquinone biosynthesis C-methylase UbiE